MSIAGLRFLSLDGTFSGRSDATHTEYLETLFPFMERLN